jgi:hypothetical protein
MAEVVIVLFQLGMWVAFLGMVYGFVVMPLMRLFRKGDTNE